MRIEDIEASVHCPYCHRYTSLTPTKHPVSTDIGVWQSVPVAWKRTAQETWWIGACNHCKEPVLVLNRGEKVYPHPVPAPSDERIPDAIRLDMDEAKRCFEVQAFRACAVMCRRALQVACLDKGVDDAKRLELQIDELFSEGIITQDLRDWAHGVRWIGNDSAHPGGNAVTKEDAEDILNLAEQFMTVLYVAPAIAGEQKKKRRK